MNSYIIEADIHTHSVSSGHYSTDTVSSMLKTAKEKGLTLLGISEHGPAIPESCRLSYFTGLTSCPRQRMGLTVLYGAEANIMDEGRGFLLHDKGRPAQSSILDMPDSLLAKLDYVIAGMHVICRMPGTCSENTAAYIKAVEHPYVRFISHPDDEKYPVDYEALVRAAIKHQVILEINNSSLSPEGYRGAPETIKENNKQVLALCKRLHHPVLLSSDSHGCSRIGDVTYAAALCEETDFPPELIINRSAEALLAFLKLKRR